MKAIISVDHKTALLAGLDNQGEYTLNFAPTDLSEAQRVELSLSETRDGAFCANSNLFLRSSKYDDMLPKVAIADLDALRAILDARIVARTKYALDKRSQEERIVQQDIHDKTDDQLIWERNGRYSLTFDAENALIVAKRLGDQIAIERIDHLKQGLPALQAELDAKKKAKEYTSPK